MLSKVKLIGAVVDAGKEWRGHTFKKKCAYQIVKNLCQMNNIYKTNRLSTCDAIWLVLSALCFSKGDAIWLVLYISAQ
jgi:hypothetical protein